MSKCTTAKCMPLKVVVWKSWSVNNSDEGFHIPSTAFLDYLENLVFITILKLL